MRKISVNDLADHILAWDGPGRCIVAIAGPPGSGKSTLSEALVERLNAVESQHAAILPMDGYHYDNLVLIQRGLRPRKGAPETFDAAGFAHMLDRLSKNLEPEIAVPVFDRNLEIARAGARLIPQSVRYLIVEGNYLLLDQSPWDRLVFDISIMLTVSRETLRLRLMDRWRGYDFSEAEAVAKVDENDMINVDLVISRIRPHDYDVCG